jgi:hypothetical protein
LESVDDDRKTKMDEKRLKKVVLGLKGRKLQRKTVTCTFCRNSEGYNEVRLAGGWVDVHAVRENWKQRIRLFLLFSYGGDHWPG